MRLPTPARFNNALASIMMASSLLAACGTDSTAPAAPERAKSQLASSAFTPSALSKSLVGVSDGSYSFVVNTKRDANLFLGANLLHIPAHAICSLSESSYGATYWNESCEPEEKPVTITAVVKGANSDHSSIEFQPALRFSPNTDVELYMYVPNKVEQNLGLWVVKYCNDTHTCVDESLNDPTVQTYFDSYRNIVFRRIKHFSGYLVNYAVDGSTGLLP